VKSFELITFSFVVRGEFRPDRTKIAELLADELFSQPQTSGPLVAGAGDGETSEASEWEYRARGTNRIFEGGRGKAWGLLSVACHLSFVFHFSFILTALGQPIRKMLMYIPRVMIKNGRILL